MTTRRELKMVAEGRIPIVSRAGHIMGTVGPKAGQPTVARFLGHLNARLGQYGGRQCWIEQGSNPRFSRPHSAARPETPDHAAARGSNPAPGKKVSIGRKVTGG